jgi:hypothetical protein
MYQITDYSTISSKQIDLSSLFIPNTRFQVFLDKKGNFSDVYNMEELLATRDGWGSVSLCNNLTTRGIIIFFGETVADYLVISYDPVATTAQYALSEVDEYPSDIIVKYYPSYERVLTVRAAKRRILEYIDPHKSLACMEAQLDAVTKALVAVLEANPKLLSAVVTAFPEFADFKTEMVNNSVFNVKSALECLAEITKTKAKLRELQAEYYSMKEQYLAR